MMTGVVAHKYTHPASKYLIPFRFFNSFDRMLEWPSDELIKKNRYGMHKALKLITAIWAYSLLIHNFENVTAYSRNSK